MNPNDILNGKKTYLVAAGVVFTAIYQWYTGDVELSKAVLNALEGLGLATLRHGMTTSTQETKANVEESVSNTGRS